MNRKIAYIAIVILLAIAMSSLIWSINQKTEYYNTCSKYFKNINISKNSTELNSSLLANPQYDQPLPSKINPNFNITLYECNWSWLWKPSQSNIVEAILGGIMAIILSAMLFLIIIKRKSL